ncbi:MAG: cytochrome c [Nitrospira sp.]|nr:cytochrome c [Nitrospira sp.]MBH0184410.1 cytochrome c [Nitrospira sp.]
MKIRFAFVVILIGLSLALSSCLAWAGDAVAQGLTKNSSNDISQNPATGDSNRGEKLYQASCIVCHGLRATGGIGP